MVDDVLSGGDQIWAAEIDVGNVYAFKADQTTVWELASYQGDDVGGHATPKPIECMARPIRNHGKAGWGVYEPFAGTGTTLLAAEMLGRVCYAIELEPRFCDVVVARWEAYTGQRATREAKKKAGGNGKTASKAKSAGNGRAGSKRRGSAARSAEG